MKSKYESEKAVAHAGLPYLILRPSIVVGDSQTGYTQHYRVFYSMLRVWLHGKIPRAPLHGKVCVDIVPVDFVCRATLAFVNSNESYNDTYHICAGKNGLVDPLSVFDYAIKVFSLPKPPISPVWVVYVLNSRPIRPLLNAAMRDYLAAMQGHFPYMMPRKRHYDMTKSMKIIGKVGVECPKLDVYGERMFLFCKESNWGRNLKGLTYV